MMSAAAPTARELGEAWKRVSRQHVAFGAACGCGIGFSISANGLEEDICEFVEDLVRREKRDDVQALLQSLSSKVSGGWSLMSLIEALEKEQSASSADFLVPRLAASIFSLDQSHATQRFSCG